MGSGDHNQPALLITAGVEADAEGQTQVGKRYTDADGTVELLVTKPGKHGLSIDGIPLVLKEAKPLPSSD